MADNPIYAKESDELKNLYSKLIGRHNLLCAIEKIFDENKVLQEYFAKAREEVLDSGNQSMASMYVIALETIAQKIENIEDTPTEEELFSKIYELESENRKLKSKLEEIKKII